jgi:hypothetical protein
MALPKLNVPVYETILPSTERVIKYRPFLVKEEKLLLTALEGGTGNEMPSAIKQIINNCVQTELDVDNLSTFDIEYLFLRLRAKSVGEEVTIGLKPYPCGQNDGKLCEKTTEVKINLEEVKVTKNEKHTNKIMLDDKIGVVMDYPNSSSLEKIEGDNFTVGMNLIKSSIKMIFTAEQTHERDSFNDEDLNEFLDSLNSEQFQSIRQFFDTMPKLSHTVKYTCSTCGEKKETTIEGLDSFFG